MTTTTSFSSGNRFFSMYRQNLHRVRSLTLFYWVLSFLFFPLQFLLEVLNGRPYPNQGVEADFLSYSLAGPGQIYNVASYLIFFPLTILMAVVAASQLMNYMHNKRAVDVYHALPVSRGQLMSAHYAAGMTAIGLPLVVNFLLVIIMKLSIGYTYQMGEVVLELVYWLITVFVIFSITAFAAVNVGTVGDTVIFALFLNAVVPAVYLTCVAIFEGFLYGYVANYEPTLKMSPLALLVLHQFVGDDYNQYVDMVPRWFAIWLVIGIVLAVATTFIYKKRQSETAESVSTSGPLKILVKFSGTFLGSILIGMLFAVTFAGDVSIQPGLYANRYFIGGTVVGAFTVFLIIEVILARSFKSLRRNIPALVLAMVMMGAFTSGVCSGGLGFASKIPSAGQISAVTVNYSGLGGERSRYIDTRGNYDYRNSGGAVTLTSPEAIEIVQRIHKTQIEEWRNSDYKQDYESFVYRGGWSQLSLDYNLGGIHQKRSYNGLYYEANRLLLELESCAEFVEKTNAILTVKPENIQKMRFYNGLGDEIGALTLDEEETLRLLEAIRTDLFAQTTDTLLAEGRAFGYLGMDVKGMAPIVLTDTWDKRSATLTSTHLLIPQNFVSTTAFLKGQGLTDDYDLSQYNMATVGLMTYPVGRNQSVLTQIPVGDDYYNSYLPSPYSKEEGSYIITDPQEIADLVALGQNQLVIDEPFMMLGLYKNPDAKAPVEDTGAITPEVVTEDAEAVETTESAEVVIEEKRFYDESQGYRSADAVLFIPLEKAPTKLLEHYLSYYKTNNYYETLIQRLESILAERG